MKPSDQENEIVSAEIFEPDVEIVGAEIVEPEFDHMIVDKKSVSSQTPEKEFLKGTCSDILHSDPSADRQKYTLLDFGFVIVGAVLGVVFGAAGATVAYATDSFIAGTVYADYHWAVGAIGGVIAGLGGFVATIFFAPIHAKVRFNQDPDRWKSQKVRIRWWEAALFVALGPLTDLGILFLCILGVAGTAGALFFCSAFEPRNSALCIIFAVPMISAFLMLGLIQLFGDDQI